MKNLVEYLTEHLEYRLVTEATMSTLDFGNEYHRYKYDVLEYIIQNHTIQYFRGKNKLVATLDPSDADAFGKEADDLLDKDFTIEEFNALMDKYGLPHWTRIYKGVFSGFNYEGGNMGQIMEALVTYMFNFGIDTDLSAFCDHAHLDSIDDTWRKSCEYTVDLLNKLVYSPEDYIAFQVAGHDYDINKKRGGNREDIKKLARIFQGSNAINDVIGNPKLANEVCPGRKDKWNPADIVIVKNMSRKDVESILSSLSSAPSSDAFNQILAQCAEEKKIIPVSLKKTGKGGKLYAHNLNGEADKHSIVTTYIKFGETYDKDQTTGSMVAIGVSDAGVESEVQFRSQKASSDNLSIELKLNGGKIRGGKGISVVKDKLGLKDNSYYKEFNSNDELIKYLDDNGFDTTGGNFNKALRTDDLYKRVCYRGFCGLFEVFKSHLNKNPNTQNLDMQDIHRLFVEFVYLACVDCSGCYYVIK